MTNEEARKLLRQQYKRGNPMVMALPDYETCFYYDGDRIVEAYSPELPKTQSFVSDEWEVMTVVDYHNAKTKRNNNEQL